jgi:GxxExxY protein
MTGDRPDLDPLTQKVLGAAIEVHRTLGPGLLESAYQTCLGYELGSRGIRFRREVDLPVRYKGLELDARYRLDFIVEDRLILELKAVHVLDAIHTAQVITYLKLSEYEAALLMNFNAPTLMQGVKRLLRPSA